MEGPQRNPRPHDSVHPKGGCLFAFLSVAPHIENSHLEFCFPTVYVTVPTGAREDGPVTFGMLILAAKRQQKANPGQSGPKESLINNDTLAAQSASFFPDQLEVFL